MLNLRHLLCAIEIDRSGKLTLASDAVHLSQSALTQAINKLEKQLDTPLFERSQAGMHTTDHGRVFIERLRRAFGHLEYLAGKLFDGDKNKQKAFIRNITTRQLKGVIALTEMQNYTAAASNLGISQPTLGKTIKDLELFCGIALFNRTPLGSQPSWRAKQMALHASLFFAETEQGIEDVRVLKGETAGTLNIGSLPLARSSLVPDTVLSLLQEIPAAGINIIDGPYDEQLVALLHGQLDFIVGALRPTLPSQDVQQQKLFDDSLFLVSRYQHPVHNQRPDAVFGLGEIHNLQWIAPRKGTPTRTIFDQLFTDKGLLPPNDLIECSSLVVIKRLLINSNRVALLSARQVADDVAAGLLQISKTPVKNSSRPIGIATRKSWQPSALQQHFIAKLQEQVNLLLKSERESN